MNERFNFIHNPPWRLSPVPPPKKPVNMPFPKYYSHRPSPQILYLTWTMCYKQIIHDDVVFSFPPLQNIKVIFLCHPPSPFPFPVRSRMNPRPNYEYFRPDLGLLLHTASFSSPIDCFARNGAGCLPEKVAKIIDSRDNTMFIMCWIVLYRSEAQELNWKQSINKLS